ncbi:hypothetical protein E2P81_ATG11670 [Venturia nashicola]|nr:hypothetical protein E2P81_ATG11670 [Venturia nashicola]
MCMVTRVLYTGCDHVKWYYELCPEAKKRTTEPKNCNFKARNDNQQSSSFAGCEPDHTSDGPCGDEDGLVSFPIEEPCTQREEVVGVDDAIRKWAGKGYLIPKGEVAAPKRKHQVSSFRLQDPTKPGHRRFIALWLVDPFQRIISTANVPPQQMNWWLDSALGDTLESRNEALSKLPAELVLLMKEKGLDAEALSEAKLPQEWMSLTTEYFSADGDGLLMSLEEAKEHRPKLMAERSAFVETADEDYHQYSIASTSSLP